MDTFLPMSTITPEQIMELVSQQLDRFDQRYSAHLDKIETKIDRVVELAASISVLQEKTGNHSNELADIKATIKSLSSSTDDSFRRMHSRVDDGIKVMAQTDERFDSKLEELQRQLDQEDTILKDGIREVHSELKKYIHIGIGMWIAASFLMAFIQWLGMNYINNIKDDFNHQKAIVQEIQQTMHKHIKSEIFP
jgi:ABC-type transporter Mla subunit MlaD